jgi:hypothetical protein
VAHQVDVEQLSPGDYVTLGLLEANPVTGSLRFTGQWRVSGGRESFPGLRRTGLRG